MLCRCLEENGSHRVEEVVSFKYMPLDSGGHTSFTLEKCMDCGGFCGFPDKNFELAIREGNLWTLTALENYGIPEEDFPEHEPDELIPSGSGRGA